MNLVLIIGGGPAGMRAAEVAGSLGRPVILADGQSSFGRKFLIAGRGGLNLTHGEPVENFPERYGAEKDRWRDLLDEFGPLSLQEWVHSLGVETYIGSSGRVFPEGQKAAGLLRAWLDRLKRNGVEMRTAARWIGLEKIPNGWRAVFKEGAPIEARAIVLALGGASYPETGSDAGWTEILARAGIEMTPWQPANCGWEVDWPAKFLAQAEGKPLKNLLVRVGNEPVSGELLVTHYGLEGGAIYRLGPALRRMMPAPVLLVDFKPQLTAEDLRERAAGLTKTDDLFRAWKLHPAVQSLLETDDVGDNADKRIVQVKNFAIRLRCPRPIAEAISSAGGIPWKEIHDDLMLRKMPGVFVAGEMIDWEAPTGGYLLQGCLATGTRAGRSAALFSGS